MYREDIDQRIASALKNGDHLMLATWRAIKNEFIKFKTSSANAELTDEKELQIIMKMAQQHKDSIDQYEKAGRMDLVLVEQNELECLSKLLPSEPSEEDIDNLIKQYAANQITPLTMKNMRDVMSYIKTSYPTANGGMISKIFKEKYI